jgi:putative membrane protein
MANIPYCGAPPLPDSLLARWNLDPILIAVLLALAALHWWRASAGMRGSALAGWGIAAFAFVSPLCALSVSLFAARIGQHMILVLLAAPLIGRALPRGRWAHSIGWSVAAFGIALWVWHMPVPYQASFGSDFAYWSMHLTLFGSAIWLWRDLLNHAPEKGLHALIAGMTASVAMGLLGAVLTFSAHPLFAAHYFTTQAWGLTPLADQQYGGVIMWVPGCALFLWASLRSLTMLWRAIERPMAR